MELEKLIERRDMIWEKYENLVPICPIDGCGEILVIRTSRYGDFWGCPRFPKCRGRDRMSPFHHADKRNLLAEWGRLVVEVMWHPDSHQSE